MAGDPGNGKSVITVDLAARITTGKHWPDGSQCPKGAVIILNAEDDPGDTIKPRFIAANGDPKHFHTIDAFYDDQGNEKPPTLTEDLNALEDAISKVNPLLVIIDPVSAYLNGVDSHKNSEVRSVLAPIWGLAQKYNTCILCISHLNKSSNNAQYRITGSLAFSAAARSTWITVKDDKENKNMFLPLKNNLAQDIGGLDYDITSQDGQPVVEWGEVNNTKVNEALTEDDGEKDKTEEAKIWLSEF